MVDWAGDCVRDVGTALANAKRRRSEQFESFAFEIAQIATQRALVTYTKFLILLALLVAQFVLVGPTLPGLPTLVLGACSRRASTAHRWVWRTWNCSCLGARI